MSEGLPGEKGTVSENGIGHPIRRNLGEPAEENTEDHHGEKGLNDCPGSTEDGLFVADLDVPPDQEVKELPVFPKVGGLQRHPAPRGADDDGRRNRLCGHSTCSLSIRVSRVAASRGRCFAYHAM